MAQKIAGSSYFLHANCWLLEFSEINGTRIYLILIFFLKPITQQFYGFKIFKNLKWLSNLSNTYPTTVLSTSGPPTYYNPDSKFLPTTTHTHTHKSNAT
jgi:hypothetical protein